MLVVKLVGHHARFDDKQTQIRIFTVYLKVELTDGATTAENCGNRMDERIELNSGREASNSVTPQY